MIVGRSLLVALTLLLGLVGCASVSGDVRGHLVSEASPKLAAHGLVAVVVELATDRVTRSEPTDARPT